MHDYQEPSLPLSVKQFRHALNAGLGRARMHLDKYGLSSELNHVVLDSALKCRFYDPQVDGLPADWFADFCAAVEIIPQLLTAESGVEYWDQAWRFALLAAFTRRDYPGARTALYNSLIETEDGDLLGAEDLVEVEGADGLLYVARRLGALWRNQAPVSPDEGPLSEFDDAHSEGAALALLTTVAQTDLDIAAYVRVLSAIPPRAPKPPRIRPTPEELLEEIASSKTSRSGMTYLATGFSASELAPIRRLAMATSNEVVLENCLRALAACDSTPFDNDFVAFLSHPLAAVRHYAALTIAHSGSEAVADLGRLFLTTDLVVGLTLLRRSAKPPDLELILASLKPPLVSDDVHDIASAVLDVLDHSSVTPDRRLLLFVYEATPCHVCRHLAVKALLDSDTCPSWLLNEAAHDASDDIRGLAERAAMTT